MKLFKGKITYQKLITTTFDNIQAETQEQADHEARKLFFRTFNSEDKLLDVEITEKLPYKTEQWRDVEDVIRGYDADIEYAKSNESDLIEALQQDQKDWMDILELLEKKEFKKAAAKYESLDTAVRDQIPDRIYNLFESLDLV